MIRKPLPDNVHLKKKKKQEINSTILAFFYNAVLFAQTKK